MVNGVPRYLKPYVYIVNKTKNFNISFIVEGKIRCLCGSEEFYVIREKIDSSSKSKKAIKTIQTLLAGYHKEIDEREYLGIINKQDRYYIAKINFEKNKEILLEDITELNLQIINDESTPIFMGTICAKCGKDITLFDSSKNGYNALLNVSQYEYKKDFKKIKKGKCRRCGSKFSKINLTISNIGKNDLLVEREINNDNWEDAFDWITFNLTCSGCGKQTKKYLDVETM